MTATEAYAAMQKYQKAGLQGEIEDASPHRLILMLFKGALDRIGVAKGCIERSETARKGETIGQAISIIDGLRACLDMEQGGEIAQNLEALYEYMSAALLEANVNNDVSKLDEVTKLLNEIKSAWDAINPNAASAEAG
jgi:flagellar protein FliS